MLSTSPFGSKFWLQDTKSSNGTFINDEKLVSTNQESPAAEIFSGDIIKFGVEVVENTNQKNKGELIGLSGRMREEGVCDELERGRD